MELITKGNRQIMLPQNFRKSIGIDKSIPLFFRLIDIMTFALRMVFKRFDTDIGADQCQFSVGIEGTKSFECGSRHPRIAEPVGENDEYFHD